MRDIKVKQKYRHPGRWPQSQKGEGTPNGGDAYLFKNKTKNKRGQKAPNAAPSQAGMRMLVIRNGKRHWVPMAVDGS